MHTKVDVVCGLGEIGAPLLEILRESRDVVGVDIAPQEVDSSKVVDVLHICYPGGMFDFISTTWDYIDKYKPELTIVHSTVPLGTVRALSVGRDGNGISIAHSPMRGKHANMLADLKRYTKFVGGPTMLDATLAAAYLVRVGFQVKVLQSCETTELAKMCETTAFGVLIAWAQEMERFCKTAGVEYEEVRALTEDVDFLPHGYFPGTIGGHCVMPNIALLRETFGNTGFLACIHASNEIKKKNP